MDNTPVHIVKLSFPRDQEGTWIHALGQDEKLLMPCLNDCVGACVTLLGSSVTKQVYEH